MSSEVYRIIPSPVAVSALQSRNKSQIGVYKDTYGYTLDKEHTLELVKPQLYNITLLEPVYVKDIQVSQEAIRQVAEAHSDVYIIIQEVVYIDPVIYPMNEIAQYAQELMRTAYMLQKGINDDT